MTKHEDILVFSSAPMGHDTLLGEKRMAYNPQGTLPGGLSRATGRYNVQQMGARPNQTGRVYEAQSNMPNTILYFPKDVDYPHPTQKPVSLLSYLIRTYTNPGDTVLDNVMGSGSTGVACVNTGRSFIGIEKDEVYYKMAVGRVINSRGLFRRDEYKIEELVLRPRLLKR